MALLIHVRTPFFLRAVFLFLVALALFLVDPHVAEAQVDTTREYQIKAAFLYNFVQFVKWPGTTFSSSDSPFYIGILGDDPFGSALSDTVAGESIDGHRLSVMRSPRIEELEGCQVIFICRSEGSNLDAILAHLKSKPILTVSELEGFAVKGGDIDFYLAGGKVRFEINPQSARQCGLKMSSQLLSLGKIVQP